IPDGGMFVLSRSNKITSPRGTFSEVSDEEWMSSEEEYKKIYAKSVGVGYAGSSAELAEAVKKRLEKEISSAGVRGLEPKESSHKH
ncbi:MAG: Rho protein, partial [Deltaproteobacteria bacterium]|nr:Rho protein [Deltaproteobacteria bacterium]